MKMGVAVSTMHTALLNTLTGELQLLDRVL